MGEPPLNQTTIAYVGKDLLVKKIDIDSKENRLILLQDIDYLLHLFTHIVDVNTSFFIAVFFPNEKHDICENLRENFSSKLYAYYNYCSSIFYCNFNPWCETCNNFAELCFY